MAGLLQAQDAWINEIHYDNIDGDTGEGVEVVVAPSFTGALSDLSVVLYNGNNGSSYGTFTLDTFTEGTGSGDYRVFSLTLPANGLQNGAPDGLALGNGDTLLSFLSYEGTFAASGGVADGVTSTDVGITQSNSTTPAGNSLYLTGSGTGPSSFTWTEGVASFGSVNPGQSLGEVVGNQAPVFTSTAPEEVALDEVYTYELTATDGDDDSISFALVLGPAWLSLEGSTLSGTPTESAELGEQSVTVSASDAEDITEHTFTLTVLADYPPVAEDFLPFAAAAGESVAIVGEHLGSTTDLSFGGASVAFTIDSDTAISFTVPTDAVSGTATITTAGGSVETADMLEVLSADAIVLLRAGFESDLEGFTAESVASDRDWALGSFSGNGYVGINGYNGDTGSEDYLISPAIDLSGVDQPTLSFTTARNFNGPELQVFISTSYDAGSPADDAAQDWVELSGFALSEGGYEMVDSGPVDLSAYEDETVRIAFLYTSDTGAAMYQLHDVLVAGLPAGAEPVPSLELTAAASSVAEDGAAIVLTVTIDEVLTEDLSLTLLSSDTDSLVVPASATIAAGSLSTSFDATPVVDGTADGDQTVSISVSADGFTGDSLDVTVTDVDTTPGGGDPDPAAAWINEFHYDNAADDLNEFIEVVISPTFTGALADLTLVLYNGNNGAAYGTVSLADFTAHDAVAGYQILTYDYPGIQNGAPDGLALAKGDAVLEFISYEGTLTAADGVAAGMQSVDIMVAEDAATTAEGSLYLTGTGAGPADFTWEASADANTKGAINTGQSFTAVNRAPVFNSVGIPGVQVDTLYRYVVEVSDPDGDDLTVTLEEGPAWLSLDTSGDAPVLTGTPTAVGDYDVSLAVSDGEASATQSFTITVTVDEVDLPPAFTSTAPTTVLLDQSYAYTLTATDPESEPLSFALVSGPAWLNLSGSALSGVPTGAAAVGAHDVVVSVTDGTSTVNQTFTITVSAPVSEVPAPVLEDFVPYAVPAGQPVSIIGTDLATATSLSFDGEAVTFEVISDTEISFIVPADAESGTLTLVTEGGSAESADTLQVLAPHARVLLIEDFEDEITGFLGESVSSTAAWDLGTFQGNGYAGINGYNADGPSEDYLISPAIDLTGAADPVLEFTTARRYSGPELQVLVSTSYDPTRPANDPAQDWEALTGFELSEDNYELVGSGPVDLSAYVGETIHIAFLYTSTDSSGGAAAQQLHEVLVTASPWAADSFWGWTYAFPGTSWIYALPYGYLHHEHDVAWTYHLRYGWLYPLEQDATGAWLYSHRAGDYIWYPADSDGAFEFYFSGEAGNFLHTAD